MEGYSGGNGYVIAAIMRGHAKHPFEESGLGKQPFSFVAYKHQKGSACDHCGRPITHVFVLRGKDGPSFNVGSTCVMKTPDVDLKKALSIELRNIKKSRLAYSVEPETALW
ncbi:hypothetical protein EKK58_05870 [Candidatus Dependentiae bacterium]|nr:MAG: hypothetical protein EKK58_05870 [Candidatus Dependentiae bacterium]